VEKNKSNKEASYVVVIGAANVDIMITTAEELDQENPIQGKVKTTLGGVGWNIALNLAKLDIPTKLVTVIGKDAYARELKKEANQNGIDTTHVVEEEGASDSFVSIMNEDEELLAGIDSTTHIQELSIDLLKEKVSMINQAKLCIVDGNLSNDTLKFLTSDEITTALYLDPGAVDKAEKVKPLLNRFYALKPNKEEAERWSERDIHSAEDAEEVCDKFYRNGNKQIFLTLEDGDVVYRGKEGTKHVQTEKVDPEHTIGGGDAFMAGLAYGLFNELDVEESIKHGIAASSLTIQHEEIVRSDLSVEMVKEMIEELEL
jgi:pseudouridine kinase